MSLRHPSHPSDFLLPRGHSLGNARARDQKYSCALLTLSSLISADCWLFLDCHSDCSVFSTCVGECKSSGTRKGGLSKGAFCAKQTFLQGNGLPSAVAQGNGLPSAVVTRHPPRPWKVSPEPTRARWLQIPFASADATRQVTCKCEWQWAGDRPVFERSPFK